MDKEEIKQIAYDFTTSKGDAEKLEERILSLFGVSCTLGIQVNQLLQYGIYLDDEDRIKQSFNKQEPRHLVALYLNSLDKG